MAARPEKNPTRKRVIVKDRRDAMDLRMGASESLALRANKGGCAALEPSSRTFESAGSPRITKDLMVTVRFGSYLKQQTMSAQTKENR